MLAGPRPPAAGSISCMQEFNREANTLASKSQDLETTRIAVEMKVADRADARAGAEHRMTRAGCRRLLA